MTTLYHTANSVYEVDEEARRVRRVYGDNPPTDRFAPEGEWKTFQSVSEAAGGLVFTWPSDGPGASHTWTSRVVKTVVVK